jgi:hypothetical protein
VYCGDIVRYTFLSLRGTTHYLEFLVLSKLLKTVESTYFSVFSSPYITEKESCSYLIIKY